MSVGKLCLLLFELEVGGNEGKCKGKRCSTHQDKVQSDLVLGLEGHVLKTTHGTGLNRVD